MSPDDLAKVDIAVVNLRCAEGMSGAEEIDIAAQLERIDGWAARIKEQTAAHAYKARDFARYGGVPGKYEMDMLTTVLQLDEGIRYDPAMIAILDKQGTEEDTFYHDARNVFLNGLTERRMGTCASLPVLYAAVARRLGYPVSLMETAAHLYLQWDDGRHKFNIEATARGGLMSHPTDHYWQWPHPVSPREAEVFHYFKPLSPRDELALFLSNRTALLMTQGQIEAAIRCQEQAVETSEHTKAGMGAMLDTCRREMAARIEHMNALLLKRTMERVEQEIAMRRSSKPSAEYPANP